MNKSDKYNVSVERIRSELTQRYLKNKNSMSMNNNNEAFRRLNLHPAWNLPPLNLTPKVYSKSTHNKGQLDSCLIRKDNKDIPINIKTFDVSYIYDHQKKANQKKMVTRFRIDSANTDRRKTINTGFHEKSTYSQPRPHHFNDDIHRPLDNEAKLGKKDFHVKTDRDPLNIRFNNETLQMTIPELSLSKSNPSLRKSNSKMTTKKIKEPKYDQKLLLPKTVYQKGRSSQDVLYQLIADTTGILPIKEKYNIDRPNIKDNKTEDFLEITRVGPRHKCLHDTNSYSQCCGY